MLSLALAHQSQSDKYLMLPFPFQVQVWRWRSMYKHFLFIIHLRLHQSSYFAAVRFFHPNICQGQGNVQPLEPEPGDANALCTCTPVQVQARNRYSYSYTIREWMGFVFEHLVVASDYMSVAVFVFVGSTLVEDFRTIRKCFEFRRSKESVEKTISQYR